MTIDLKKITNPDIINFLSDPENSEAMAKGYLLLGGEAEKNRNWDDAIECYRAILRINPVDPVSRYFAPYNIAHALFQLKRFEEATGYAHAAVAANMDWPQAYNMLGVVYKAQGKYQDAVWYLLAATLRAPTNKNAWLNLQAILAKHPEVLADIPYLADAVESARKFLEARGALPKAH